MPYSTTPLFNLKVVLKETGLPADTLRAWERRYGLPAPNRTSGGHRLYSQRDIETIKWLTARQGEGLSISRAVDLWNEQLTSGADPLAGVISSTLSSLKAAPATLSATTNLATMRNHWIEACTDFNEAEAEQTLNQAFAMFPVEDVCVEVLQKGLAEIGAMWYENRISVQQEHFASALAMRRLDTLLSASPTPTRKQTVLVACPAGEWHTFTSLLLALFLRRRGLNVIYLGANVPAARLQETVEAVKADLAILVAQTLFSAGSLQYASLALTHKKIEVAYGGRIFNLHPELTSIVPGHHLGNDISASITEVDHILNGERKSTKIKSASQEYVAAHQFFTAKRAEIELTMCGLIQPLAVNPEDLISGITHLGNNIAAALQLGDMNFVSSEMEWLKWLIQAHNHPAEELSHFLDSYIQAVNQHFDDSGRPIIDWLFLVSAKPAL